MFYLMGLASQNNNNNGLGFVGSRVNANNLLTLAFYRQIWAVGEYLCGFSMAFAAANHSSGGTHTGLSFSFHKFFTMF